MLLLDDTQGAQDFYRKETEMLCARGFRRLDFKGPKPASVRVYQTTIFYRNDNVLGI